MVVRGGVFEDRTPLSHRLDRDVMTDDLHVGTFGQRHVQLRLVVITNIDDLHLRRLVRRLGRLVNQPEHALAGRKRRRRGKLQDIDFPAQRPRGRGAVA